MFGLRGETRTIAEPLYSPRSVPPASRRPIERHCARRRALARYTLVCELGVSFECDGRGCLNQSAAAAQHPVDDVSSCALLQEYFAEFFCRKCDRYY